MGLRVMWDRHGEEGCRREPSDIHIHIKYLPTYTHTYLTVMVSIIALHSCTLKDLTSHITEPMISKGMEILQEVNTEE